MKKLFKLFIILLISFTLISCGKETDDTLSVVFYSAGGSHVPTIYNLEKGSKISEPEEPTINAGYFIGWYKEENHITKWDFENDTVENSITLYAKWGLTEFTITYHLNGGSFIEGTEDLHPTTYTIKSKTIYFIYSQYTRPTPPSNTDFKRFRGWWTQPNLTEEEISKTPSIQEIKEGSTGDIDLYAYYR